MRLLFQLTLASAFACAWLFQPVAPKVVGAAVLPHGDFAYDPTLVDDKNHSLELHKGAQRVGASIAALDPELIVVVTPHGMESERNFIFYGNTNGSGFAHLGDDLHNASFPGYDVNLSVTMDPTTVKDVAASLVALNPSANVSTLLSFADSEAQALRWGEVIPLRLVFDQYRPVPVGNADADANTGTTKMPNVIVWSVPSRRYTDSVSMVASGELTGLGQHLGTVLEALSQSVVLLISADLAHTHLASGPYGYSKDAEPFDEVTMRIPISMPMSMSICCFKQTMLLLCCCCCFSGFGTSQIFAINHLNNRRVGNGRAPSTPKC